MTPQEAETFAALWTAAQAAIAAFLRTFVRRRDESDELLQRTAMTLVRKYHEYDCQRSFVAWAIGVAKMELLAYRRERASDRHVFDGVLVEKIAESHMRLADGRSPVHELLVQCVEELDGRALEAIRLKYGKQMKTLQVAESLDLSYGAARMLLTRARTVLRQCVEKHLKSVKTPS
jgi:RNA polymerase sigma-70 factor, ECF subfamily